MGTETENCALYYGWQPITNVKEFPPVTIGESIEPFSIPDKCVFTITLRRMSRRRVVKQLMAQGKSRNTANAIARTWGGNYARHYVHYVLPGALLAYF